jgi:hypothetical protein
MPVELVAEKTIAVGNPTTIEGRSPSQPYAVIFEDDGDTGYLYGLDFNKCDNPIIDALHIYNVANIADRVQPSNIQLVWSCDGLKAGLLINRYPHAIFDFESKRGYCRTGFPPPDKKWTQHSHEWSDEAQEVFR